jgi:hypothetical protein
MSSEQKQLREIGEVVGFWRSFGENNAAVQQMCKTITRILNGEPPNPDAATMDWPRR